MKKSQMVGQIVLLLLAFGILSFLLTMITEQKEISTIVAGAISAIGGLLKTKYASLKEHLTIEEQKVKDLGRRLAGPRFSLPEKSKEKYVRVAIAGLGGTGKTSLIRKISGCKLADPRKKTGFSRTYSIVKEIAYEDRTEVYRIDLEDYRGQNISDLLQSIRSADKKFPVTAFIMMVDLFDGDSDLSNDKDWDSERVAKHISEWPDQLIGALLFEMPELKYVCLFINKVDLISAPVNSVGAEIEKLFSPITRSIKQRGSEKIIRVMIGSALTDRMLSTLTTELIEEASVNLS